MKLVKKLIWAAGITALAQLMAVCIYAAGYDPHTLSDFGYRTVDTKGSGTLVFQEDPGGAVMSGHSFNSGDQIFVNLKWREKGYTLAYDKGEYGFVDAAYINWGGSPAPSYDPHNLDDFVYKTVNTKGPGNLVFQTDPGGAFMYDHQYSTGSQIYVNAYWRENGYALAYDNGEYGFVDAQYIVWDEPSGDPHDLSNYGYRVVDTQGDGQLVFQTDPGGDFMYAHSFNTGDLLYVNLYWRQNGYALAYDNGSYGFVDARYIRW